MSQENEKNIMNDEEIRKDQAVEADELSAEDLKGATGAVMPGTRRNRTYWQTKGKEDFQ